MPSSCAPRSSRRRRWPSRGSGSLDSVRGFAGDDYEVPVIEPEVGRLLTHRDERAVHYEVAVAPF
jgi:hypothetical protein